MNEIRGIQEAALIAKLEGLEACLESDEKYVIDENLHCIRKGGVFWYCRLIQRFICSLFCQTDDLYSDLRMDRVAASIARYCQEHEALFRKKPELIDRVNHDILGTLLGRVPDGSQAYVDALNRAMSQVSQLVFSPSDKLLENDGSADFELLDESTAENLDLPPFERNQMNRAIGYLNDAKNSGRFLLLFKETDDEEWQLQIRAITNNWHRQKITIPCKILFFLADAHHLERVILMSRKIIGKGGERTVKLCFDLKNKTYHAKKPILNDFEAVVVKKLNGSPGIISSSFFKSGSKIKMIEPFYEGTLSDFWKKREIWNLKEKVSMMIGLLRGLAMIHRTALDNPPWNSMIDRVHWKQICLPNSVFSRFPLAHCDIKPQNILVRKNAKGWEAVFCDFGAVGDPRSLGSIGYRSPEYLRFMVTNAYGPRERTQKVARTIQYHADFGQKRDLWAIGLVFARLLAFQQAFYPGNLLPSIKKRISRKKCEDKNFSDFRVHEINQEEIAEDITQLREKSRSQEELENRQMDQIWLIIESMLEVDPEKRTIRAEEALELIESSSL